MNLTVPLKSINNFKEIPIILYKQQNLLDNINQELSMYSLNRYLHTPLAELDITKISMCDWFYQEQLILSENNVTSNFAEYDSFLLFLTDYAKETYQVSFLDDKSVFSDYQYIEFILYVSFINELDKLEKAYCECFNIKSMSLSDYVMTTFSMYFSDELPLNQFINMLTNLHLKTYLTKNIQKLKKGKHHIYDISPFRP